MVIYAAKEFEYRKRKRNTFPNEDDLIIETKSLQSKVFDKICRWEDDQAVYPA